MMRSMEDEGTRIGLWEESDVLGYGMRDSRVSCGMRGWR